MIQSLQIQNFRCFQEIRIDGFERLNLIGGKNNSGKTCLLEAIACLSNKFDAGQIAQLRGQSLSDLLNNKFEKGMLQIKLTNLESKFECHGNINGNALTSITRFHHLPIHFFTQKSELPVVNLINSFDEFDQKLKLNEILEILKIVDDRIETMRTYNSKPGLWIKTKGNEPEQLSNFGDATKNIMRYITPIFEKKFLHHDSQSPSILLIDEIENGLHYSIHEEFWKNILLLSKKLDFQIFATTHSSEMITAFNNIALVHGGGSYFEMARDIDTDQIFAQKHDMNLLQYELETPKSTFRGE
mgnify:CR=1 FL=1